MKKRARTFLLLSLTMLLTGCIDIIQVISLDNGELDLSVKYTIQKSIMEMGSSMADEELDYSELLEAGEEEFEAFEGLSAKFETIETPLDVGIEVNVEGDLYDILKTMEAPYPFVPKWKAGMYEIVLPSMNDGDGESDEDDGFAMAFLSSARYRLLVDLNGDFRGINKVKLRVKDESVDEENMVGVSFYNNILIIEIPIIILMMSEEDIVVQLIKSY